MLLAARKSIVGRILIVLYEVTGLLTILANRNRNIAG